MHPGARAAVLSPDGETVDVAARPDSALADAVNEPNGVEHVDVDRGRDEGGGCAVRDDGREYEPGSHFWKLVCSVPNWGWNN